MKKINFQKKKLKNFFDIILYGFHASIKFKETQKQILKNNTRILFETNSMTSFTEDQRKQFNKKILVLFWMILL